MKLNIKIILLFLAITSYGFSQTSNIKEIGAFLSSKNRVSDNSKAKIQSLVKDLYPSIYVNNDKVVVKGENPICLYTDLSSLKTINTIKNKTENIDFVAIRIKSKSELNSMIDLSVFKDFVNLKYILLVFEFNIDPNQIDKMVTSGSESQSVFYKIEIQS